MGEYFKGRRRKTGVVTLVMALAFTGGWVRSISTVDFLILLPCQSTNWFLISGGQHWRIVRTGSLDLTVGKRIGDHVSYVKLSPNDFHWSGYRWYSETATELGIYQGMDDDSTVIQMIPYWSITIPPTLISLWLLLSNSRISNPKKIDEPVAVEGA